MSFQLTVTTSYLTSRKQFGVTLNKFQPLTLRAADMCVSLESTAMRLASPTRPPGPRSR